jgi:Pentapeptide repeats (8 copies)
MASIFNNWQLKIKQSPLRSAVIIGAGLLGIGLIMMLILGYWLNWDWTGLNNYTPPVKDGNFQRGKTLWDWLQLLIIPIVLAVGGFLFSQLQKESEQKIAGDNQREAALQAYIDNLSELLLEKRLREPQTEDEVRTIARVRTLTLLPQLDSRRKASVLKFLYESRLILSTGDGPIVDIDGADFSGVDLAGTNLVVVDLRGADLTGANLTEAQLKGARLFNANLKGANLSRAYLAEVDLSAANLTGTNLTEAFLLNANLRMTKGVTNEQLKKARSLKGAKMPDGSTHA